MLDIQIPLPVKFVAAVIYSSEKVYAQAKKVLQRKYGDIDYESLALEFKFTEYYAKEMGCPLFRRFISFRRLIPADRFAGIKRFCIKIEKKFAESNKRRINIDPGYLNEAKFVLTTTKDFFHRIYLGKGVFAEVTLYYRDKNYCDFGTTYPDYRSPQYKSILIAIRSIYRQQIKFKNQTSKCKMIMSKSK